MPSDRPRPFGEQRRSIGHLHRGQRIVSRPRRLEGVPATLDLAVDISGLAGYPRQIFKTVVVGFDLRARNTPVL